jgi:hypothetical protein
MKPKTNRVGDKDVSNGFDRCQTPEYAVAPLLPYMPTGGTVWECACGDGNIAGFLERQGFGVERSDLLTGQNFFDYEPARWDRIVTNPPYSVKYDWLARCYELGKPFALLLPVETMGANAAQRLFEKYGIELILLDKRVNFKMPNKGYTGGGAQFPVAWFCWGFTGQPLTFALLTRFSNGQERLF